MEIKYLGHSAFLIKTENGSVLIDPFVELSQDFSNLEYFKGENLHTIFVTHAHSDHFGQALKISRLTNATIVAPFELGNFCLSQGVNALPACLGGCIEFPWGSATLVPAQHSSSLPDGRYMGVACGIMLNIEGKNIYHAGDTALSSEMEILSEFYAPAISILPIGGHYTMGIDEASFAAKILGSQTIIPMHYNTFPPIKVNINEFVEKCELVANVKPLVMNIDEQIKL